MIVSRFAPAPTGFLHLGHVVNALHVWGITRTLGGRVLLRIEDHDQQRSRPGFERAILDDLDWLGFVPDEPPTDAFRAGTCRGRQCDRHEIYESALASLAERRDLDGRRARLEASEPATVSRRATLRPGEPCEGDCEDSRSARLHPDDVCDDGGRDSRSARLQPGGSGAVYACDCTRRELRDAMEQAGGAIARDVELRYPGRCATRGLSWRPGYGLRVRIEDTIERFVDLRHGLQEQRPFDQCGDILLKDRDGNWTYQFAVTVDDMEQGVNLVIRGDDLLASTGRQILLARMLGREEPPRFLHHALIMKSASQKLSKADRDTSVRDMRVSGAGVEEVIGRAMHAAGFTDAPAGLSRVAAEALVSEHYRASLTTLTTSP